MRSLFAALFLVGSTLVLAGCDNGNKDSTSGGGSALDVTGTWYVQPNMSRTKYGYTIRPYHVTLGQAGKAVTSSAVVYDPMLFAGSCDTGASYVMQGTASGNTFTGRLVSTVGELTLTEDPEAPVTIDDSTYSLITFTVTGTSSQLSGSYRAVYYKGPCLGAYNGTVSMRRQ